MRNLNSFNTHSRFHVGQHSFNYYSLEALDRAHVGEVSRLPFCLKIMLENLLRHEDGETVTGEDIEAVCQSLSSPRREKEIAFRPARVLMQDFTGVPAVVDLATMRDWIKEHGGDPNRINPLQPVDLVIDHSVQVDQFGTPLAFAYNAEREFERNDERYTFLKWGQQAFNNFRVVPPETGIVHQVNLEYLACVVFTEQRDGQTIAYPDTLVGTDSHTTMINGMGVVGWGVGGIEAEAAMLGQPLSMLIPEVVGFKLYGELSPGATATDLVLTVTEMLRKKGVVGKFVEYYGPGIASLSLADRATLANMSPEYGATIGFFPVDDETLAYLRLTGRDESLVALVEAYTKSQGLFRTKDTPDPIFSDTLELDLSTVEPSLAGPRRPQDRVPLRQSKREFRRALVSMLESEVKKLDPAKVSQWVEEANGSAASMEALGALATTATVKTDSEQFGVTHGSVVISAITSCTNTSNPSVMIAAGLLAKKAVERGLTVKPWVKTSLAPGSKVVTDYLRETGLITYLEALRFHLVGYGCTTCLASGTPVLLANGTSRRIEQMPSAGGAVVFSPLSDSELGLAEQAEVMAQGVRDCVSLVLQDGRTLVCTPDHEILCAGGRWVRADQLVPGRDRVVVGLEAPLDEPGADEAGYVLNAGDLTFTLDTPQDRLRTLAFARLLGHLLGDGSISVAGQGRMTVGQAVDREAVLNDIEVVTGKRPAATRYDERKWAIALPMELTNAVIALSGVRVGRRIHQAPTLPAFVLDDRCPTAVVREFLGGAFGADGQSPLLHRLSEREEDAILSPPAYSQTTVPEHVEQLKHLMHQLIRLLARCGVKTRDASVYEFPVRRSASSYPAAQDGAPRIEVRLKLPDGLSFVERVGFRYCVDKTMRASAAAVYWRIVDRINQQRLWMSARLDELPKQHSRLTFSQARQLAALELSQHEAVIFPHYSLLEGHDRFDRLPKPMDRQFRPLHRDPCGFPSPVELFEQLGVRGWFAPLLSRKEKQSSKRYCVEKTALALPTFTLQVLDRRPAGPHAVFDLAVSDHHAFVASTVCVHNCIGNSGPLPDPIAEAIRGSGLVAAAVLSGNRNFEGRINPLVRANYLASPPLVVAYALAGTMDIDFYNEPIGQDRQGEPIYLKDIWPTEQEVREAIRQAVRSEMFRRVYSDVFRGDERWSAINAPTGERFAWDEASTYIKRPPFFDGMTAEVPALKEIRGARVLAVLGDSVTTDHISPAGSIHPQSPAGKYLIERGVQSSEFNSYGARRGNHEVMMRGTFANVRLRNQLVPGTEGGWTVHLPDREQMSIYDAAMKYQQESVPLLVIAGKEYGSGSSRDWAAKGSCLLGVRAVLAESFERIHRSNLVGMGILPLQFLDGENRETLGLTGFEVYDIKGIAEGFAPRQLVTVRARSEDGSEKRFQAIARVDTPVEVEYYRHGGILKYVLRELLAESN